MKKLHLAIATDNLAATVADYSKRLSVKPALVIENVYALWRTESLNLSIRQDPSCPSGTLRHLGWEDPEAETYSEDTDVNGIVWETFSAAVQVAEINEMWPQANYRL